MFNQLSNLQEKSEKEIFEDFQIFRFFMTALAWVATFLFFASSVSLVKYTFFTKYDVATEAVVIDKYTTSSGKIINYNIRLKYENRASSVNCKVSLESLTTPTDMNCRIVIASFELPYQDYQEIKSGQKIDVEYDSQSKKTSFRLPAYNYTPIRLWLLWVGSILGMIIFYRVSAKAYRIR